MNTLVTYFSESGNTEKLAQAIYEGIDRSKKTILPLKDAEGVEDYDLIFCGFPVHSHSVPGKMESFIKKIPEGKKVAFFATHGSLRGGELAITAFYHALTLASKLNILGTFGSRGKVKPSIIDALMQKAEHKAWAEEAQSAAGHPDEGDLEDARDFAKTMVTRALSQ
jgi:flavodoxin